MTPIPNERIAACQLTVLEGAAESHLPNMPDASVHLCVTSPPYDNLRTYGSVLKWNFEFIAAELFRLLVPGGIVCWNVNDGTIKGSKTLTSFRQALHFQSLGFRHHETLIWHKPNFAHPDSSRYHQLFEFVFIISKGKPRVFNPICDKPNAYAGTGTVGKNTMRQRDGSMRLRKRNIIQPFGKRGNVWHLPTSGQENMGRSLPHPAMMGERLCRDLIASYSNIGDMVLDPLAGSGTTGKCALEIGRRVILIEKNQEYVKLIQERVTPYVGIPQPMALAL